MKSIIMIAAPSAGKGTLSGMIKNKYNIPHISTGDLLKEEVKSGSEYGEEIKKIQLEGKLVDTGLIFKLLKNRLLKDDCNDGYILDGCPRNLNQAELYEQVLAELNKEIGVVIFLDITKEEAIHRMSGRVTCDKCNRIYNLDLESLKPKVDGICDDCGSVIAIRHDDNIETYEKRYNTFLDSTMPLINYYKDKGILYTIEINENSTPETTFEIIDGILKQ